MNATELARDKFNALFAVHDAKDVRASSKQKPPMEAWQEGTKKDRDLTMSADCAEFAKRGSRSINSD